MTPRRSAHTASSGNRGSARADDFHQDTAAWLFIAASQATSKPGDLD